MLINQTIEASETTDNLLTNSKFSENTDGWILSDTGVKRDPNSYSGAGNSPTVRFNGQTSTISQLVNITGVEQGKEIKSYTLKYNGYGCGNTPNGWCNDEADDTITTNITFTDGTTTEISSHTVAVPYEDGWTHHTFTKSINDTFLTGEVAINFELSGVDTGNSSSWLGPITDNYQFLLTYDDYIAPVVEPVVVEPVIEEIVVIEETMIGGLELSTEVTLDLIQEIRVEIPQMEIDIPEVQPVAVIDISMPEISIDIPIQIEMPVDIPDMIEVEPIQEIQEIQVQETPQQQPEMVETTDERREIKPEAESKIETVEAEPQDGGGDLREAEGEEGERETKESTADADKGDEPKETTAVAETKETTTTSTSKTKTKPKPKTKGDVQTDRPTSTAKKNTSRPKATLEVSTAKPQTIEQLPLPIAYLQIITDSISMVDTISLRQEQIYGGEQEYNLNTSSITIVGLDNNSSRRWSNLQNERKRFKAPKYVRTNN